MLVLISTAHQAPGPLCYIISAQYNSHKKLINTASWFFHSPDNCKNKENIVYMATTYLIIIINHYLKDLLQVVHLRTHTLL